MECKFKFIDSMSIQSSSKFHKRWNLEAYAVYTKTQEREKKNNNKKASTLKRNDNDC